MTRLTLMTAALALVAVAPATAQTAAPDPHAQHMMAMMNADTPLLAFSITEELQSTPNRASIGAGVTTQATTAVEAMRLNADAMTRVIRAIKARGIAERDIQTSGINLSAQYDYNPQQQGQPPRLIGYQVSNQVRVSTTDLDRLGPLMDALVAAGGTNIDGPSFTIDNPDAALDSARQAAMRRAADRAMLYARAAGYARARLISVTEGGGVAMPPPMPMFRMRAEAADVATPVQPGQVSNAVTLTLQYRLEK